MRKLIFLTLSIFSIHYSVYADSLDIKIGQMLMVGYQGRDVKTNSTIISTIKKGLIGGVLLYEYNVPLTNTKNNLHRITTTMQDAATIPLLISIDQEGGQVNRLKTKYGFPAMPSAYSVGQKKDDVYSTKVATTITNELIDCGINVNYGPVLDIHNPLCPVLGARQRCYSSNVEEIAHQAQLFIEAHNSMGVKTVVKHFPGHGNARADSHLGIADVSNYWNMNELIPYKMLIDEGVVNMVMTAHIINSKLDKTLMPATLSKKVITTILREQLGFRGVVISDDMQMQAISKNYGFEESIKKAINAGVDILMFSNNIKGVSNYTPENLHATIKKLVLNGSISQKRIDESYARIMSLKRSR
jgi:beta-N-acetylhexosaminidase